MEARSTGPKVVRSGRILESDGTKPEKIGFQTPKKAYSKPSPVKKSECLQKKGK